VLVFVDVLMRWTVGENWAGDRAIQTRQSQTNLAWEVLLNLEGAGPLHDRLRGTLRAVIRSGRLARGTALPPSRTLAAQLRCSRWVVTEAYAQLVAEGYLEARTGSATRVRWSGGESAAVAPRPGPVARPPQFDLSPGVPDLRAFPRRRWAAALRAVVDSVPFPDLAYPPPGGHARLRRVLGEYLQRCRGAAVGPEGPVLSTGVTSGVVRVCRRLLRAGIGAVAVEEPGWSPLRRAIVGAGLETVPVPIDADGLRVDELVATPGVRAVLVAPAHQFPTGAVLASRRRAALLEWARRADGVVLENDYDAEFRYDRRPVASLQGMDPERVCLLGSVTRTLAPAVGIGWIVAPERWRPTAEPGGAGEPPLFEQLAFAACLESGDYDRHLRASRQRYRARRDAFVRALEQHLPGCRVSGAAAGLHLLLTLHDGVSAADVVVEAARRDVRVLELDACRADFSPDPAALVLGYCNLSDAGVEEAVGRLAAAVQATFTERLSRRRTGSSIASG
jgi:GntR family transcriptional regulator/MocR family aminotransferase